jgi:hypothetical protein
MATIKLTDQLGLEIGAQPAAASALLKYFQELPALRLDSLDLSKIGGLTLDQPAIQSLTTGLSFQDPVTIGDGPALSVAAGVNGSIRLITNSDDLPGHEDDVELAKDACYVCFGIEATASPGITVSSGILQFGAAPSTKVNLASCSRFKPMAGVTLLEAICQTVGDFTVPATCDDLAGLAAGQITQVGVSGKLTFSGTANLLAATNPLASATLPAPLPVVSVSAGGSVTVGATCSVETEYEVVARKVDSGAVHIGWYRKNGREVKVQVTASEGIAAGIGSTDIFPLLIGAISSSPNVDLDELKSAGLPESQRAAIDAAVKAAVCRKLQIAVEGELTASSTDTTVFLYELLPAALDANSRAAVEQALRGDLSALHAEGLAGVSCIRSVWDTVRKSQVELDVNLLGILNYRSVASLSLEGKVLCEQDTGALVISDTATAQRIQSVQVNFGADTQKLRHVLAESFLITAAYRCAGRVANAPDLRCSQVFFDLQNSTSSADMACKLRTGLALNLLSADEAALPAGVADFGRTLFVASADFDDNLLERLFLDSGGMPLPPEAYEAAGRAAIQFLVQPGDPDEVRRRPAIEDPLWQRMKQVGQPGLPSLFLGVPAPFVGDIISDYTVIQWWASAMVDTAQQLAKVRLWLAHNSNATADSAEFQSLREQLAVYLRDVAANTRAEFGQPWGLIAMNQLAGPAAPAKLLLIGPLLVRRKSRGLTPNSRHRPETIYGAATGIVACARFKTE